VGATSSKGFYSLAYWQRRRTHQRS